jgi:hypothetical protein
MPKTICCTLLLLSLHFSCGTIPSVIDSGSTGGGRIALGGGVAGGQSGGGEASGGGQENMGGGNTTGGGNATGGGSAGGLPVGVDAGIDSGVDAGRDAGARTDAGIDAGLRDAGFPIDGGIGCPVGLYVLCENFESSLLGGIPSGWTSQGAVSVVSAEAHWGTRSLKAAVATNGARRINFNTAPLGTVSTQHWGRVFYKVKLPAPMPTFAQGVIHSTIISARGLSPVDNQNIEARFVDLVINGTGKFQYIYNVQPATRPEFATGGDYVNTYDGNWHCAEWYVSYATQSFRFFTDGIENMKLKINKGAGMYAGIEIPQTYGSMSIGWNNYQAANINGLLGYEAWFDDFALSGSQIGCSQ